MELNDTVDKLKHIDAKYLALLSRLDIYSVKDLLTYFPYKYIDTSEITKVSDLPENEDSDKVFQVKGNITDFKNVYLRSKLSIQSAIFTDDSGSIKLTWFNQRYLSNALKEGSEYIFSGKIKRTKNTISFQPTFFEEVKVKKETTHLARITPEYYLTKGISKKWLRNRIKELVDQIEKIEIPDEIGNIELRDSIRNIHFPDTYESLDKSIKLLSQYEFTNIQLKILESQLEREKKIAPELNQEKSSIHLSYIIQKIPFELTADQKSVVNNLITQINLNKPLNALIQGDVGSGKTIIGIIIAYILAKQSFQTAILAPTTILAKQHYDTFSRILASEGINIELVTGQTQARNDSADILIGTSAILARKSDLIRRLGLIIVDEQHRFGVNQREDLLEPLQKSIDENGIYPHFLNMTATPIPRTVAQALFGDIDVEIIKTKPVGRKPIKTHMVPEEKRNASYAWVKEQVDKGDQVYWVCPLISDSEKTEAKSAEFLFKELSKSEELKNVRMKMLHGRMRDSDKLNILREFNEHEFDILVSTSVIEVGIDVSNATIVAIENAERFGLAQLHQIRGRVGRGEKDSYCLVFYPNKLTQNSKDRLKFFSENDDGLKIAEFDMKNRGPGEIYGFRQSGIPKLKIANFADLELIKQTRVIALKLYKEGVRKISLFER